MGFREMADVLDGVGGIAPEEKLVAVALADRCNEDGVSWVSMDQLCRFTCQSETAVRTQLRTLEEAGVITREERPTHLSGGKEPRDVNICRLNLSAIRTGALGVAR